VCVCVCVCVCLCVCLCVCVCETKSAKIVKLKVKRVQSAVVQRSSLCRMDASTAAMELKMLALSRAH